MKLTSKKKKKLATDLLHLLYLNKLEYSSGWESWTAYLKGSDDRWVIIDYPQLLNIAALIVSGITMERADKEMTKILLQEIERWVTQSDGRIVCLQETKTRSKWYPACLVDIDSRELVKN